MAVKKLPNITAADFLELRERFTTDAEIARHFNVSRERIRQIRVSLKVDSTNVMRAVRDFNVANDRCLNRMRLRTIAQKYQVSMSTVQRILKTTQIG